MGRGLRLRLLDLHASPRDPSGDRLHARHFRRLRRHAGDRIPGVLRGRLSDRRARAATRGGAVARAGGSRLQAGRTGDQSFPRHDPAIGPRPRAAARPAGAAPRRTCQRSRSAGEDRDARTAEAAAGSGQDDPRLQPHPSGVGGHLQSGRHHRIRPPVGLWQCARPAGTGPRPAGDPLSAGGTAGEGGPLAGDIPGSGGRGGARR